MLFADIVDSTRYIATTGDCRWLELLIAYHTIIRKELKNFNGWHLDTAGDGFLAAFDRSIEAVYCAATIRNSLKVLGLDLRIGIHTGDCVFDGETLAGLTLHIGARVAATANPGEILVSEPVRQELENRAFRFASAGSHNFKGVPGDWRLSLVEGCGWPVVAQSKRVRNLRPER